MAPAQSCSSAVHIDYLNGFNGNSYLEAADRLTRGAIRPYRECLDSFLSCLFLTTEEKKRSLWTFILPCYLLLAPVYFLLLLVFLPLAVGSFLVWMTFQHKKVPYRISVSSITRHRRVYDRNQPITFLNANVCLLPEFMSRFNNLSDVGSRAKRMGSIIAESQLHSKSCSGTRYHCDTAHQTKNGFCSLPNRYFTSKFDTSILTSVPSVDFALLTEGAWDIKNSKVISRELHQAYPYIVYDVAAPGVWSNYGTGTSGLLFASKYPLLKVNFNAYTKSCKQCVFASKGLLQIKISLGKNKKKQNVCGFFFATHLQVYQGHDPVQYHQLGEAVGWLQKFKQENTAPDDVIAFDIFAGDLNFDNLSPGTEMRQPLLYDKQVSTPAGLAEALADDILMQTYVLDGDVKLATLDTALSLSKRDDHGNVIPSPAGGRRRIDYIMPSTDTKVEVVAYNTVTAFAGLTDHIPMFLAIKPTENQ